MIGAPPKILKPLYDARQVREAFRTLVGEGAVTELRALDATTKIDRYPRTLFGYFDRGDALVEALGKIQTARGIYIIPNQINPALLARAANRIKPAGKGDATQDSDIIGRRWLLVDCDAVRPANISANDAEHDAATQRARDIYQHLRNRGWPEPLAADSGNGGHLLFRIDLPTDDGGLVQRCLQALSHRFSDVAVKVDEAVFNPARIWKLYGSLSCKGDDVPGRPWRMARILKTPDELQPVPVELLQALAAEVPTPEPARDAKRHEGNGEVFDVADFIRRHGFEVDGPSDWNGKQGRGKCWTFRQSPMCDHHDGAAYVVQHASGAVSAGCHHAHCAWTWADLRAKYEPAKQTHGRAAVAAKGLSIQWEPAGRGGSIVATASLDGEVVAVEKLDVRTSKARSAFVASVCCARPALDAQAVEADLLRIAGEVVGKSTPAPTTSLPSLIDLPEIDPSCIVRPERFITPEVSGVSVPTMVRTPDGLSGRWLLFLQWADGRRQRDALPPSIDLAEGRRLWIHPFPPEPTANTPTGWSPSGRAAWLKGAPPPDPADVFKRVCERIAYFIDLPQEHAPGITATLALWVMVTYCYPAWDAVPYLYVGGPIGSGKSRVF